jgi:hypothetical protein
VLGGSGGGGDLAEVEMVGEHDEVEGGAPDGVRRCSSITTVPSALGDEPPMPRPSSTPSLAGTSAAPALGDEAPCA